MVVTMVNTTGLHAQEVEPMATHADERSRSRTIKASVFKATCLRLMDEVAATGEEIVITKNGRPTARLLPYRKQFGDWFGADRDRIGIIGDIISPIDVEWEAAVDPDRVLNP